MIQPSSEMGLPLKQWLKTGVFTLKGHFALKGHLAMSGGFMDCHNLGGEGRPLASGGQRSGMLPNILQAYNIPSNSTNHPAQNVYSTEIEKTCYTDKSQNLLG